ncbi:MAG: hypothetical protein ACRBM6_38455 [Geminicoccales bacterium]
MIFAVFFPLVTIAKKLVTPLLDRFDFFLQLVNVPASWLAVVVFIGFIELLQITGQTLITPRQCPLKLGLGEVPILVVHRLQPRTVDSQELAPEQIQLSAEHNKRAKHLLSAITTGAMTEERVSGGLDSSQARALCPPFAVRKP